MEKSKVYYCDMHTGRMNLPEKLKYLMKKAGFENIDFEDKYAAIKIHFGEPGNLAYLRPNWAKVVCDYVKELGGKAFLTDCNTLYVGGRKNALDHLDSAYTNGYNPFQTGVHTIIADGLKGTDEALVPVNGEYVKEAKIGQAIMDADIIISLNHFKGHELTGFGGALKNIGMGCGSRAGKMEMHSAGKPTVHQELCIGCGQCIKICAHDAPKITDGKAKIDHNKCVGCGRCIAENDIAIVPDVGMFASFDPVALDQACADAVNKQPAIKNSLLDKHGHTHHDHFTDVSPETNWKSCLEHAEKIGLGTREYELIEIK